MAVNINVTEDENLIDINDVNVFTVHVKDLSTSGQIQISEDNSEISEDTVDTTTEIRTIDLPTDQPVNISVNETTSDTVTIITTNTDVIEVSDNISIVTAASEAASRQLRGFTGDSLWDQSGNNAYYNNGNVGIGTSSPSSKLQVTGNIEATTFTGVFIGTISSSAQIAANISGAFASLASTVSTNTSNITTNQTDIATNQTNISANQSNINTSITRLSAIEIITGSLSQSIENNASNIAGNLTLISNQVEVSRSLQSRLSDVEAGSTSKTLISSSIQLSTEISGAFTTVSSSIESRLSDVEAGSTSKTLISSSVQIAAEISGAFFNSSESIATRISTLEAHDHSTFALKTEISGAFSAPSSSISTRITSLEEATVVLPNNLVSSSTQLSTEISGANAASSASFSIRTTSLEGKVGQEVNTTSDVEFNSISVTSISASGNISASTIRTANDAVIGGNISIEGGNIFGLFGAAITIDDIRVTSGSVKFGSGSDSKHEFTGSVFTSGSVHAHNFIGTFIGALSSSAQIDTNISGAFFNASHSLQSRLTSAETELDNALISASAQIATEISGAFFNASHSLQSRLAFAESELGNTLISASAQIATNISGAFTIISSSIEGRISTVETELGNTLISGSSQLSTEISGAFTEASHSLQSRLSDVEAGSTSKTLISSSAQIATDISGAFNNITFDSTDTYGVVVYDNLAKRFYYTGSYAGSGGGTTTGTTTQYALSPSADGINLSKLVINDFSDSVTVNTDGGILQLTFGNPTDPFIESFTATVFDTDRFNKEIDNYTLDINYNLYGRPFTKGELSASTAGNAAVGVASFNDGQDVDIDSNFSFYQSGSHTFTAKVFTSNLAGNPMTLESILDLQLNKILPGNPTIAFSGYNITKNAFNESEMEIEEGAIGNISVNLQEGSPLGWTAAAVHNSPFSSTLTVNQTGNVTTGEIEEYWNSANDNDPVRYHTGSAQRTFTRVRSLRYKVDSAGSTPTESQLQNLANWSGIIAAGTNTKTAIENTTMEFNPSGQFIFIIYDAALGNLSEITNQEYVQNEINAFNVDTIGNYKYYRTKLPKTNFFVYKIKFAN